MRYRALAVRADGSTTTAILEADSASAARRQLSAEGLTALELRAAANEDSGGSRAARGFDVDLFCQELLALVSAGVTVSESLETLAGRGGAGEAVLRGLVASLREGQPLSAAMERMPGEFPVLLRETLRAAERTSDYGPSLARFVRHRRLAREVRGKLVSASVYPLLLLGVSGLVLLFLIGYVVPRFAGVYADMGDRLPASSRLLLSFGSALHDNPWAGALGLALLAGTITWLVRDPRARAAGGRLLRHIPRVAPIIEAAEFSRLYRTLALLLHGGIPMVASLNVARGMLGAGLVARLDAARTAISEGRSFSDAMSAQGLSTPIADRFFRVGEGSGKLAEMIDRAADFHEEEVARGADLLGRVIGPFLMLVMGVVIGLVVVLMYMPIFSLAEAIQ